MDGKLYDDLVLFLEKETLPSSFESNKSNFLRDAKKYELVDGHLKRKGKFVLRKDGLDDAWKQYHIDAQHSGNKFLLTKNFDFGGKTIMLCFRDECHSQENEWFFLDEGNAAYD